MFDQLAKMPHVSDRIKRSRFKSTLDMYAKYLIEKGYASGSIRHHRNAVEHFFNWLESKGIFNFKYVNQNIVNRFIKYHLKKCNCSKPAPKRIQDIRCALNLLLKINNKIKKEYDLSEKSMLISDFKNYLLNIRGLVDVTCRYHCRNIHIFLDHFFRKNKINIDKLNPKNIRNYIYEKLNYHNRRTFGLVVYSIRTFFKYLQYKGIGNELLIDSLPRIIEWKSSKVPDYLSKEQIAKLMNSFDRNTGVGIRDYAISVCILETGMRAGEVAKIEIDDINWRSQTIKVPAGKTRQEHQLPMTRKVIVAIVEYLKNGRPHTKGRRLFVFHRAPVGNQMIGKNVTDMISRHMKKLGIKLSSSSSNLLRRSFAKSMLEKGSTIKEIADMLRHRSINTSMVYTKVDFKNLIQVAMPWPEEVL